MNKETRQSVRVTEQIDYDIEQLGGKKAILRGGVDCFNGDVKLVLGELIFTFKKEYSLWAEVVPESGVTHTVLDIPVKITYQDEDGDDFTGIKVTSPGTNHTYFTYGKTGKGFGERDMCFWNMPAPKLDNIDKLLLGINE